MKTTENKILLKTASILIVVLFAICVACGFWLYGGQLTPAKVKIFSSLPLPMAFVGGQSLPMNQFLLRYSIAQKLPAAAADAMNAEQIKNGIYNQLISEAETAVVAEKYGVEVSQNQIDAEYQNQSLQQNFQASLHNYGADEQLFKSQIIKPELLTYNLEIWFNSEQSLNQQLYTQADSLIAKIQAGQDMGQMAAGLSQDQSSQAISGDLGFVDVSTLLPELREPLESMEVGDIKILPSRYGLHVIRLEGTNGNLLHLRQIFLTNPGFQTWYQAQTRNIKIEKLIGI